MIYQKQTKSLILLLGIYLALALPAYAQKTLVITSLNEPIDIRPYLEIIPDSEWQYDSDTVLSGKLDHLWQAPPAEGPLLVANSTYQRLWFRVRVDNRSNSTTLTWHDRYTNAAYYFYALASQSNEHSWSFSRNWSEFNDYIPGKPASFPSWRLNTTPWISYSIPLDIAQQETWVIGQAISNPGFPIASYWQWVSQEGIQTSLLERTLFSAITITIVAVLSLYYLVVFLRLQLMPCLWLSVQGLLSIITLMTFDKSLWGFEGWVSPVSVWRIANTGMFFGGLVYLVFIASALETSKQSNQFRRRLTIWASTIIINWVYFIVTFSAVSSVAAQLGVYISLFIAWGLLYTSTAKRVKGARLLFIGSIASQLGAGIYIPSFYGWYEPSLVTEWALHLGIVAEFFCFSLVLSGYTHRAIEEKNTIEVELQAKNNFFASMTHELRTPLTAILGYSDSSITQGLSKTELEANSKIIERSGQHLLELINNNLDISKIEAGKLELDNIETDMSSLIQEIEQCFRVLVTTKGLTFNANIKGQIPNKATLDPMRVKQILMNLCSNAIKFTEVGGISIQISWLERSHQYQFIVEDTGIGLSKAQCKRLFNAYTQAEKTIASQYGGTGLGLNLCKNLAELMQGNIRVESEPNKGSRFIVCIKPESVDRNSFIDNLALQSEQLFYFSTETNPQFIGKILIAESDKNVCHTLKHLIESAGLKVDCAENGKLAMSVFFANDDYNLIICAIDLPKMDGVELARRINNENSDLPIIALGSNQEITGLVNHREGGFSAFLDKPIRKDQLYALLSQYLPSNDNKPESLTEGPLRVLLAEDNLDNQKLIPVFLKKAGANEVVVAENGHQAISLARASDFDLILMDIQMPEIDGLEATRLLRKMNYRRRIYALTADDSEECVNEAKVAGCNGHLNKPIEFEKMLHLIQGIKEEKSKALYVRPQMVCQTKLRKVH